jgi:hypothetical protein
MAQINEVASARAFLFQRLTSSSSLQALVGGRIQFVQQQPDTADTGQSGSLEAPFVRATRISGHDIPVIGGGRAAEVSRFLVEGIVRVESGNESWALNDQINVAIDNALVGAVGAQLPAWINGVDRRGHFEDQDWDEAEGVLYLRQGGYYVIMTSTA